MPKELTHWKIAEESLEKSEYSSLKRIILNNKNLYLLGAVFPDTLLYGIGKKLLDFRLLGVNIHDNAVSAQSFLKEGLKTDDSFFEKAIPFAVGIVTHLETDAIFHPSINWFSENSIKKHYLIETALDQYFTKGTEQKISMRELLRKTDSQTLTTVVSRFFKNSSAENNSKIISLFELHAKIQSLFFSRIASKLISFADNSLGGQIAEKELFYYKDSIKRAAFFLEKRSYLNLENKEIGFSPEDLYQEAIEKITTTINTISRYNLDLLSEKLPEFINKIPSTGEME